MDDRVPKAQLRREPDVPVLLDAGVGALRLPATFTSGSVVGTQPSQEATAAVRPAVGAQLRWYGAPGDGSQYV